MPQAQRERCVYLARAPCVPVSAPCLWRCPDSASLSCVSRCSLPAAGEAEAGAAEEGKGEEEAWGSEDDGSIQPLVDLLKSRASRAAACVPLPSATYMAQRFPICRIVSATCMVSLSKLTLCVL